MGAKSSSQWLRRQRRDRFANAARCQGHPSRAYYKIEQLDKRFELLRDRQRVLELGAAPGGWTAYVAQRIGGGCIVAVDPRPILCSAKNLQVVRGCLGEPEVDRRIAAIVELGERCAHSGRLDLVLSDMAPNISGVRAADQATAMNLAELASGAACKWLQPGGVMVVKIYQGEGVAVWLGEIKRRFAKVQVVKPPASRPGSRENYVVARGFRGAL